MIGIAVARRVLGQLREENLISNIEDAVVTERIDNLTEVKEELDWDVVLDAIFNGCSAEVGAAVERIAPHHHAEELKPK